MVKVSSLRKRWRAAWWWLRQVSGDAAYEAYLRNTRRGMCSDSRAGRCGRILSREEFYLDSLRRKYSGISRCC